MSVDDERRSRREASRIVYRCIGMYPCTRVQGYWGVSLYTCTGVLGCITVHVYRGTGVYPCTRVQGYWDVSLYTCTGVPGCIPVHVYRGTGMYPCTRARGYWHVSPGNIFIFHLSNCTCWAILLCCLKLYMLGHSTVLFQIVHVGPFYCVVSNCTCRAILLCCLKWYM